MRSAHSRRYGGRATVMLYGAERTPSHECRVSWSRFGGAFFARGARSCGTRLDIYTFKAVGRSILEVGAK